VGVSKGVQLGSETFRWVESQMSVLWIAVTGRQLLYWNLDEILERTGELEEKYVTYFTCHAAIPAFARA
jgi:hypothetical protein